MSAPDEVHKFMSDPDEVNKFMRFCPSVSHDDRYL